MLEGTKVTRLIAVHISVMKTPRSIAARRSHSQRSIAVQVTRLKNVRMRVLQKSHFCTFVQQDDKIRKLVRRNKVSYNLIQQVDVHNLTNQD